MGTTALRDNYFGIPANAAERAALANSRPIWYNTTYKRNETYYAVTGTVGLTVPGLLAGSTPGWYALPTSEVGGKSGPVSHAADYRTSWARGWSSPGATIDTATHDTRVLIRMDGIYECHAFMRGGAGANYLTLALDGNRVVFEERSNPPGGGPMLGIWVHDHPGGQYNFSVSHYWGTLYAGDLITAGAQTGGTDLIYGAAASNGALVVKRIS
jgi:hypothetical protein